MVGSLTFIPHGSDAQSTDINVNVGSALTLTVSPQPTLMLDIFPAPGGTLVTEEITATVGTNNPTGYTLTMKAEGNNTALTHTNGTNTMPSTTAPLATPATLPVNTWGYNKGAGASTFLRIPPLSTPDTLATGSAPTNGDVTIVTVGAMADINAVAGVYTNGLVFTATANYVPAPTVTSVSHTSAEAGNTITVTGTNFYGGGSSSAVFSVKIGSADCVSFNVISNTSLTCVLPGLVIGTYPVTVVTSMGTSNSDVTVDIIELIPLPPGTPDNISPSNPAVLDVTPTTGWEGSVITITSNALFTNVTSVTIGGTACTQYDVVSTSIILCRLPAKSAGSVNNIVVINNGTDVANAGTNNHMRITYFDPNRTEIVGGTIDANGAPVSGGTAIDRVTFDTFTSTDCGNMTLGQIINLTDIRNNQTYRVKKMTNNANGGRCWMIDSLKYPYGTFTTSGYLTVDGGTGTGTNLDIARYVNPMGQSYCIGNTNMPAQTLTRCGYLYNWFAATYGTGNSTVATQYTNVVGSICPNNSNPGNTSSSAWQLPTGLQSASASGNFAWLNALMNNQSASAAATTGSGVFVYNWLPTGQWQGLFSGYHQASITSTGSAGFYWSSTTLSATNAYRFDLYSNVISPGNGSGVKHLGLAVRCVMP